MNLIKDDKNLQEYLPETYMLDLDSENLNSYEKNFLGT